MMYDVLLCSMIKALLALLMYAYDPCGSLKSQCNLDVFLKYGSVLLNLKYL